MTNGFVLEEELENVVQIDLPVPTISELAHLENIIYCRDQLLKHPNWVIGFTVAKGLRTTHINYMILPEVLAQKLNEEDTSFSYRPIDHFLQRIQEIYEGKYKLYKGLIIAFNKDNKCQK